MMSTSVIGRGVGARAGTTAEAQSKVVKATHREKGTGRKDVSIIDPFLKLIIVAVDDQMDFSEPGI
jgi:hypothetical protein